MRKVLNQDWASYADGDFTLVNNPWNQGKLDNGSDYTQSIAFDTMSAMSSPILRS